MTDDQFKQSLIKRRTDLGMSYKDIQQKTKLGYNTVRRAFNEPWDCKVRSIVRICKAMGCVLDFVIEGNIGDEIEPDIEIEETTAKVNHTFVAE